MQKTGSEIVYETLLKEKVDTIFGYPGGAVLPLYDTLTKYPQLKHILTRHEQGAAFAAEGYARAANKVGVCLATSGPGATNLITGLANAYLDSIPLVAITGQVASDLIGTDAFQEADLNGITLPITKHNFLVARIEDLAPTLKEAFAIAQTGRPGPVHLDIAKDIQIKQTEFNYAKIPQRKPKVEQNISVRQLAAAKNLLLAAQKPVVIAGHGVLIAGAMRELKAFCQKIDAPVVTTLLGISSIPCDSRYYLGMLGMHGQAAANFAVAQADTIIAVGSRFDDRITGRVVEFARQAKVIHIEIDPAEIDKIIPTDVALNADARVALIKLLPTVKPQKHRTWWTEIQRYQKLVTTQLRKACCPPKAKLLTVEVIHALNKVTPDAFIATDVGQNQMWTALNFQFKKPGRLLTSGGLGAMGFGLPAGLGAAVAVQGKFPVWVVTGDGGLQMNLQELTTLAAEKIPLKIAVLNNGFLGMVRQWQELFYQKNYSAVQLFNPDFVKLAQACGVPAWRCRRAQETRKIIEQAVNTEGPALIDFVVEPEENVFPMMPPGAALSETRIC